MGEATQIEFTQQGYRQLVRALAAAVNPATPAATATPEDDAAPMPWIREDGGTMIAFLDDRELLRWIRRADLPDVPAGWRPLLVGRAVVRVGR